MPERFLVEAQSPMSKKELYWDSHLTIFIPAKHLTSCRSFPGRREFVRNRVSCKGQGSCCHAVAFSGCCSSVVFSSVVVVNALTTSCSHSPRTRSNSPGFDLEARSKWCLSCMFHSRNVEAL